MSVLISPNMGLPVPVVSQEPGPNWAQDINASLSIVDGHDHSPGSGVQITPAGLNINADLPFNNNNLTLCRSARFQSQSAALSGVADLGCLYVVSADLYFNDGAGNQIRLTQSGSIVGTAGSITGLPSGTASAAFAAGTFTFQSATNTPATMAVGPLVIGAAAASPKTVTLSPSLSQAANYALTFPTALPGSTLPLTLDSSGNIAAAATLTGLTSVSAAALTATGTATSNAAKIGPTNAPTFKMTTFSGTLTASNTTTISVPADGTTIIGLIGMTTIDGGTDVTSYNTVPMNLAISGLSTRIYYNQDNPGIIELANSDSSHTNAYTVTMFYI